MHRDGSSADTPGCFRIPRRPVRAEQLFRVRRPLERGDGSVQADDLERARDGRRGFDREDAYLAVWVRRACGEEVWLPGTP